MKITRLKDGAGSVKLDTDLSQAIIEGCAAKFVTRVGILGKKVNRTGEGKGPKKGEDMTNAELGLVHEKGSLSRNIPARSFLEVPLVKGLSQLSKVVKIITKWVNTAIKDQKVDPMVAWRTAHKDLGIEAEGIVQEAFETRGGGDWAPNAPATLKAKYPKDMPLINTGQLRRSIMSQVAEK